MTDDDYYEKRIGKPERLIDAHPLKTKRDTTPPDSSGLRKYLADRSEDTLKLTQEELEWLADMLQDAASADDVDVRALTYIYGRLEAKYKTYLYKWSRDDD